MKRVLRKTIRVTASMPGRVAGRLKKTSDTSRRRESWDRRWGDDSYQPQFELADADAVLRAAVDDGWFTTDMRTVDIGCGLGHNAAWLAEQGFEVVGIDFSLRAIERAREDFAGLPGLTFEVVDAVQTGEYVETFDALVDRGCLHGIERPHRPGYVANLEAWARPGAHFLLFMRTKDRTQAKTVERARRTLGPRFDLVETQAVDLGGKYADEPLPAAAMRFVRAS